MMCLAVVDDPVDRRRRCGQILRPRIAARDVLHRMIAIEGLRRLDDGRRWCIARSQPFLHREGRGIYLRQNHPNHRPDILPVAAEHLRNPILHQRECILLRLCLGRHDDRHNRTIPARLVEILQIKRIVHHLIFGRFLICALPCLELQQENNPLDDEHNIHTAAHTRDGKLKGDLSVRKRRELLLQNPDLRTPRILLQILRLKRVLDHQLPKDMIFLRR